MTSPLTARRDCAGQKEAQQGGPLRRAHQAKEPVAGDGQVH